MNPSPTKAQEALNGLLNQFPMTDNMENDKIVWRTNMTNLKQKNKEKWFSALDTQMKQITGYIGRETSGEEYTLVYPNNSSQIIPNDTLIPYMNALRGVMEEVKTQNGGRRKSRRHRKNKVSRKSKKASRSRKSRLRK